MLSDCPGLKVQVMVEGELLKKYDDDEDAPPNTVTKYVEAISDARFKIKCFFIPPFPESYGIRAKVILDGREVHRAAFFKTDLFKPSGYSCEGALSILGGRTFVSEFRFAELQVGMLTLNTVERFSYLTPRVRPKQLALS